MCLWELLSRVRVPSHSAWPHIELLAALGTVGGLLAEQFATPGRALLAVALTAPPSASLAAGKCHPLVV